MLRVESQDGKTYRTQLKDFKGILFFSILQTIWISPSQSYNWSGSQLHNPTNVWMLQMIWLSISQSYKSSGSYLHKALQPAYIWNMWIKTAY